MLRSHILAMLVLFPIVGWSAPDALLERLLETHATHGDAGLREFARGIGITLREEHGILKVPVIVDRRLERDPRFHQKLQRAAARLDASSRSWSSILVPAARLGRLLAEFPDEQLHAPIPHTASSGMGSTVSESVALTGADGYQAGNLTGAGVRVAVVDLGFQGLSARIAAGELPQNTVAVDFTGTGVETTDKHGTGVAEHVLDMAPGVQLYCLKVDTQVDLQNAADYIAANNIRIANHSVGWFAASYYNDTGPINAIINDSRDRDGVFWSVAAGNLAQKHWRGNWLDVDGNNRLEFAAGDDLLRINGTAPTVTIVMNWNQYGLSSKTDLDLYVFNSAGQIVASSTVTQSRFNDPAEFVTFAYQSSQAPYDIRVTRATGGTAGLDITLFSLNHNLEYAVAAASQADPANAHGAFSVGAINRTNWLNASPAIRAYSSRGPTTDNRLKPDLVAPDGTSSVTYPTASGTSFAAPTVAGAAALLKQELSSRTAAQLASLLQSGAIDAGAVGPDTVFGYGKLQLPLIDTDLDLLSNVEELQLGTNPLLADSDGDRLSDYAEVRTWGTNPLLADSDGDGAGDYDEVITFHTDPLVSNRADLAPRGAPDGVINTGDLLILTQLVTGQAAATGAERLFGDLNDDGMLGVGDVLLMTRRVTGLITLP